MRLIRIAWPVVLFLGLTVTAARAQTLTSSSTTLHLTTSIERALPLASRSTSARPSLSEGFSSVPVVRTGAARTRIYSSESMRARLPQFHPLSFTAAAPTSAVQSKLPRLLRLDFQMDSTRFVDRLHFPLLRAQRGLLRLSAFHESRNVRELVLGSNVAANRAVSALMAGMAAPRGETSFGLRLSFHLASFGSR